MSASVPRLFTAVVPAATVQADLAAVAAPLAGVGGRRGDNIHLTLRFLGETDEAKAGRCAELLARVRVEPFILPVGGVGLLPSRGPAKVL